ncbi:hypothetical protein [Actinokineospora sp. NPDC004072]
MQPALELSELDELVDQLDTQISQVALTDDSAALSLLLCSFNCGDDECCSHWC